MASTNRRIVEFFFLLRLVQPAEQNKISTVLQFVQTAEEKIWITYGFYKS